MDELKKHWLKLVILLMGIAVGWGALHFEVSANSKKLEKLEQWQHVEEKEGARISAQLEIVIEELRGIKSDIRRIHNK